MKRYIYVQGACGRQAYIQSSFDNRGRHRAGAGCEAGISDTPQPTVVGFPSPPLSGSLLHNSQPVQVQAVLLPPPPPPLQVQWVVLRKDFLFTMLQQLRFATAGCPLPCTSPLSSYLLQTFTVDRYAFSCCYCHRLFHAFFFYCPAI